MTPKTVITDKNQLERIRYEDDALPEPLSPQERTDVLRDLQYVRDCQRRLRPRGIRGIYFMCEDCDQWHYYDWDIMEQNMISTLNNALPPVHEPSANPDVNAYVTWDYALGYMDGIESAGR